ncbi:MAG: FKBP-type peptidyl-prolyl cis-trans isomerase [Ginsengibacter sp.]
MKKLVALSVFALLLIAVSCKKNAAPVSNNCTYTPSTIVAPLAEQQALQDSLTAHGIQATKDSSGLFYIITKPGSGTSATSLCSTLAVYYRAGFFDGKKFDSTSGNPAIFQLGRVIAGWQKAIPKIARGGEMTLYIPPSLGYGSKDVTNPSTGAVVIPANSNLVFDVVIVDVR